MIANIATTKKLLTCLHFLNLSVLKMDSVCMSNVFANIAGWFAFALLINCTVTTYWIYVDNGHLGLFNLCATAGNCQSLGITSICKLKMIFIRLKCIIL